MSKSKIIIIALAMLFLCACGLKEQKQEETADNTATINSAEAEVSGIKFGFVLIGDESDVYTRAHIEGIKKAAEELGISADRLCFKYNIPADNSCYLAISELVEEGCSFVATNSYGHQGYAEQAASDFPKVKISAVSGDTAGYAGLSNFSNAFTKIYEARYVSGVVAGLKLAELYREGKFAIENMDNRGRIKVGYVGAYPYAEVVSGYTAFFLGIKSVYENASLEVMYTNSWFDEAAEKEAAESLIADGCVIIGQHADSTGAPEEVEKAFLDGKTVYCVGYNIDMLSVAPNTALTSATNNWDVYYAYAMEQVMTGKKPDTNWAEGYESGAVGITTLGPSVSSDAASKVSAIETELRNGSLKVFDTQKFTVKDKQVDTYLIDLDGDMLPDTEAISDGCFNESMLRSAPSFDIRIDGITEISTGSQTNS